MAIIGIIGPEKATRDAWRQKAIAAHRCYLFEHAPPEFLVLLDTMDAIEEKVEDWEVAENELNELHDYLNRLGAPEAGYPWGEAGHASNRVAAVVDGLRAELTVARRRIAAFQDHLGLPNDELARVVGEEVKS